MHAFGESMQQIGFPCGVALVWIMISWQLLCSIAILSRRLVVPACAGHIVVLAIGVVIVHWPDWFIVGPGENGMEFPLVYVSCYASCMLAYWPRRSRRAIAAPAARAAA